LTFDGVFRDATVWVNGWLVKRHEGGYYPFREDLTDVVKFGEKNSIAVRVDATKFEGWFYEGAGIYRHVWLDKTAPLAIAPDGVFVYSTFKNNVPAATAQIHVEASLLNALADPGAAEVSGQIISPDGQSVAQFNAPVAKVSGESQATIQLLTDVSSPVLWSPDSPKLYKLIISVRVGGKLVDEQETSFGIRTMAFDPAVGFLLNGKRYEIHGTCDHQDHAGVGTAIPDALQDFRVKTLKEFSNALRTAHNPPTPELLDACDRLGMLVMDECRTLGSDSENLTKWTEQIRRDRNHPCVFIWSIGNEERAVENTPQGAAVALSMQNCAHRTDPTRPVTYAAPNGNMSQGINSVIEVRGWNYHYGPDTDAYHAQHPNQPNLGTEQASVVGTRGNYANDWAAGRIQAYDIVWPGWEATAESWWSSFANRSWLSGGFAWTGFDYRGEPSPCPWPCINSQFGILDTCGFPKDSFYYYQAWWTTRPVLHLTPHWNWPGREGQEIRVEAQSNCKQVELFLNGDSLGKQPMPPHSKLVWQVKYTPGVLSAKGFDAAGNLIAETSVQTTGAAVQVQLTPDRKTINADGQDVAVFTVAALDQQGRVVPLAQNAINFSIAGAGKIIGVGNGNPTCHEPDTFAADAKPDPAWARSLFNGLAQVIVQSTSQAGEFKLSTNSDGLMPATAVVQTKPCKLRPSVP
jgi:beta-galactosidase